MKCKKCGAIVPDGAYFCGECGELTTGQHDDKIQPEAPPDIGRETEQPYIPPTYDTAAQPLRCPGCQTEVHEGELFCPNCGRRIKPDIDINPPPVNQSGNGKIIAAIICSAAAVCIAAVVVIFFINRTYTNTTDTYSGSGNGGAVTTLRPAETSSSYYDGTSGGTNGGTNTAERNTSYTDYLFPSDVVYITDSDLAGKSQSEVRLILNEIYARHGYIFTTDTYRQYFESQSWYNGNTTSQETAEARFNQIERANKNFIVLYEQNRGWR